MSITIKTTLNETEFIRLCKFAHIETGRHNELDYYIDPFVKENEDEVSAFLFSIFVNNRDNIPFTLFLGILYCIKKIKNEEMQKLLSYPTAVGIVSNDPEIAEMSIRCYEQWETKFALSHLKSIKEPIQAWLKSYKQCIIRDLEEKFK